MELETDPCCMAAEVADILSKITLRLDGTPAKQMAFRVAEFII